MGVQHITHAVMRQLILIDCLFEITRDAIPILSTYTQTCSGRDPPHLKLVPEHLTIDFSNSIRQLFQDSLNDRPYLQADGTRYLLLLCQWGGYVIDRSYRIRRVQLRAPATAAPHHHKLFGCGPAPPPPCGFACAFRRLCCIFLP